MFLQEPVVPTDNENGTVYWLLSDHLGSTAITANNGGGKTGELRYYPFGSERYNWGNTPTTYRFTGQRSEEAGIGLYFYLARWYDPALGRFVQADTIVPEPGNPQAWDRYAYTNNNPLYYTDPSGHAVCVDDNCNLVWNENTKRHVLRGIIPPPIRFIYEEMTRNVQSPIAHAIRVGSATGSVGQLTATILWTSQVMDAGIKKYVGPLSPLLANWDHKPILTEQESSPVPEIFLEPRDYSSVGSDLLKFDIWSNIHYGYVGRALGFSQWKLTAGAGVEQIGSDKRWGVSSHFSPGADNWFASWDHPSDNAAIQIGIHLWEHYQLAVTPADIYLAILENPLLERFP